MARNRRDPGEGVQRGTKGFTLIELIAVIVVLAVLAGVAIPKYFNFRDRAKTAAAAANLKLFSTACHSFKRDNGVWPTIVEGGDPSVALGSYLEHGTLSFDSLGGFAWFYGTSGGSTPPWLGLYAMNTTEESVVQAIDAIVDNGDLNSGRMTGGTYGSGTAPTWIEFYP